MDGLGRVRAERSWIPRSPPHPHLSIPTSLKNQKSKKTGFLSFSNADDHPGIAGGPVIEAIKGEERAFIALVGWESVAMHEVSSHLANPQPNPEY
jgi:hypothetical protein